MGRLPRSTGVVRIGGNGKAICMALTHVIGADHQLPFPMLPVSQLNAFDSASFLAGNFLQGDTGVNAFMLALA